MAVKNVIAVYNGPVAAGLTTFDIPDVGPFTVGAIYLRVYDKDTNGTVNFAVTEMEPQDETNVFKVGPSYIADTAESQMEWRIVIDPLVADHYQVDCFSNVTNASVLLTMIVTG